MRVIGYYANASDAYCTDCWPAVQPALLSEHECDDEDEGIFAVIFSDTESDTPAHCRRCEVLIPHRLTDEGYAYVHAALAENGGRPCIHKAWWNEYGDGLSGDQCRLIVQAWSDQLPDRDAYSPVL